MLNSPRFVRRDRCRTPRCGTTVRRGCRSQTRASRTSCAEFNTNLQDVYDASADAWHSLAPLPTARSGVAAALAGRLFVFGGERTGGVFIENEAYDPQTDRWSTMAPMRTPRHGTGEAVVGQAIYIPAGGLTNGGSRPFTVNEAFVLT